MIWLSVILPIVLVVGSLVGVFRTLAGLSAGEKQRQELLRTGRQAEARVRAVRMGGMSVTTGAHRQLELGLTVEVHARGAEPYTAEITSLVSELQIPLVQPGAWIAVRVHPDKPALMAIEAMGITPSLGEAPPTQLSGVAPPPPPPAAVPVAPMGGFRMPLGAKIGLAIGLVGAVVGITVAIVAVSWTTGAGGPSDACKRAAACCRRAAGKSASASSCGNFTSQTGPIADRACEESVKAFQRTGACK
jgi:hypothetical protein